MDGSEKTMKEMVLEELRFMFSDEEYGFEVFVTMKEGEAIKHFILESNPWSPKNSFKHKVQREIRKALEEKFFDEGCEYDKVQNIADEKKNTFYVIPQSDEYKPFHVTMLSEGDYDRASNFSAIERDNVEGMLFCFTRGEKRLWAYQYLYQNAIPNRKGNGFNIFQSGDVFVEQTAPMIYISKRIDLLILNDNSIVSDNTKMLERNFGFEVFVRTQAQKVSTEIISIGIVANIGKVSEYVARSKPMYARKMMRIKDSKVLKRTKEQLYESITTLPRWKGKFTVDEESKQIVLEKYEHVENLIDLLDERFTRSDVTGEEYDTGAKKWVAPVAVE